MNDTPDGSSSAAHGAQDDEPPATSAPNPEKRGFWRKLFGGTPPSEQNAAPSNLSVPQAPVPGMLNLRRMRVEDVLVPKADVESVPITITKKDLVEVFRRSGFTRLPVFDGTLDTPLGFVHLKDFALRHGFNGTNGQRFALRQMLRPLLYVPPSMPIGVLLTKMQADRVHMALVIDEYGGADGVVTIEDLIEQVIGEIEDEHDIAEGQFWRVEKPGCYIAQAKAPLDEFQSEIGMSLTEADDIDAEDIDTLGGLAFMLAGKIPARGEVLPHPTGAEFEIVDADARRIKRLRVRLPGVAMTEPMQAAAS